VAEKNYTLIIVPDHQKHVRRFLVPARLLVRAAAVAGAVVLLSLVGTVHYFSVVGEAAEYETLQEENLALRSQLKAIRERVEHIGSTLDRVEQFDQKLRAMTLLSDPERNLAVGPTGEPQAVPPGPDNPFVRISNVETPRALSDRLDRLSAEATRQEQSLQELQAYFADQKSLLASTPSVWPVRGLVTSDFGVRVDPYTAERVMHTGLDIAGPHGKEILAPSDGTVVFAGLENGYGNVLVVDHGYGIKTRYAHLASIKVKPGQRVQRGQSVAALGNTGRSTGPHLHYEVRVNGVPQNPRKFILDD
jgi:murein DD-endopeptidase MepM/ murein hydrolase activator NlpD